MLSLFQVRQLMKATDSCPKDTCWGRPIFMAFPLPHDQAHQAHPWMTSNGWDGASNPLGVNIFQECPFSWRWASCLDPNGEAWTEPIHSISNSCHHPLSSEYVIPRALIALALRKTYKKPTKPIKILWGPFGVSWFVWIVSWCFGGIIVVCFFAKKTPRPREYPKP